jgi:hypothetical protein
VGQRVDPPDLARRPDLIDREVFVDGRVQGTFQFTKGKGFDEFRLLQSTVVFRLPGKLAFERPPRAAAVNVRGILKKDGDLLYVEVAGLQIEPADSERLEKAVAALNPGDFQGREAWARWAEHRGRMYADDALVGRARELEAEAIRLESELPGSDAAAKALELAERAKRRKVPEPELSALAHQALRPRVREARTAAEVEAVVDQIETYLPASKSPGAAADLSRWQAAYDNRPAAAYRRADAQVRRTLDRRLLADGLEKLFDLKAREQPKEAIALAEEARTRLPDRPAVADRLKRAGLEAAATDIGALRQAEVESLSKVYRDELHQPEKATELLRQWLDDQRLHRLSRDDAEGRLLLAGQYEALLGDRATAEKLLREAWKIDPQSKATADLFRRKGFRLVDGDWQPTVARSQAGRDAAPAETQKAASGTDPYLGLTPGEVRDLLGKPERIARVATQGQLHEQWTYQGHYITFVKRPEMLHATVVAHTSLR